MTIYCCVTRCTANSNNRTRLFQIPKSEEQPLMRERLLKTLNIAGQMPELLYLCEKHLPIIEDEEGSKNNFSWNPAYIKTENEEPNLEFNFDEDDVEMNLKTFMVYPNKKEEPEETNDVYEILANLDSTETSNDINIVTEDLKSPTNEALVTHSNVVLTNNPFLQSNTTIELDSSDNEAKVPIKKKRSKKAPPKKSQKVKKNKEVLTKKRKRRKRQPNIKMRAFIKDIMNKLHEQNAASKEPAKKEPIVTISIDSSDDELQEIKQPEISATNGERKAFLDVPQDCEQSNSPEVLILKEKLRIARRRVSEVSQELHMLDENLKKIFNPDQLRRLKQVRTKSFKWNSKTLKKALHLFFICGEHGYRCILNQNYPLPSVNVLRRIVFDFKAGSEIVGITQPPAEHKASVKYVKGIIDKLFNQQTQKNT